MPDAQDMDLVREFARHNSEAAFTELVRRHVGLVYSVARRCTGNDGDAQDVTQAVFIILARKAVGLREHTLLPGWLYETTRFTAARLLRTNARRQQREQEAYMQSTLNEAETADVWEKLSPHLEDAMSNLAERDRALLVLRFYQNKSGPEAAALMGIREGAAHMRVTRAIEKLRKFFAQRGVTLSGEAIAGAISVHSIQVAPAVLAKTVTAIALAKGIAASGSTWVLATGVSKLMAWAKAKTALAIATGILFAAGAGTIVYREQKIWAEERNIAAEELKIRTQLQQGSLSSREQKLLEARYEQLRVNEYRLRAQDFAVETPRPAAFTTVLYAEFCVKVSPFTTVQFEGNKITVVYNGAGCELAAINDLPMSEILDFCRKHYGASWDKHFAGDLATVLSDMQHPINAEHTVSLTLVNPQTGERTTIERPVVTGENSKDNLNQTNQP